MKRYLNLDYSHKRKLKNITKLILYMKDRNFNCIELKS